MKYIGSFYWVLSCILGSSIYSYILIYEINSTNVFYFIFSDFVFIDILIILLSLILTSPFLLFYKMILKGVTKTNMFKTCIFINCTLFIMLFIAFMIFFYLMKSIEDSLILVFSFGLPGFLFSNLYWSQILPPAGASRNNYNG